MIDFEKDRQEKENYYEREKLLRLVFSTRNEVIDSFRDRYYKDIVKLKRMSPLVRNLNSFLLKLLRAQLKHEYISTKEINDDLMIIKRLSDETHLPTIISDKINSMAIK